MAAGPGFGGPRLDSPRVVPAPGLRAREPAPLRHLHCRKRPRSGSLSTSIRATPRSASPASARGRTVAAPRAVAPPERVEDQRQGLRRDALASFSTEKSAPAVRRASTRTVPSTGVADRVLEEVLQHAPEPWEARLARPVEVGLEAEGPSRRRCCRTPPAPRPAPRQESCCPRPRSRANRAGSARTGHPRGHRERRPNGIPRVLTDRRGVVDDAVVDRLDHRPKAGQRRPQVVRDGRDRSRRWASTSTARARQGERRPAPTPSE